MAQGWVRRGCFGCVGVIAFVVAASAVIVLISEAGPEDRQGGVRDHAVPVEISPSDRPADVPAGTIELDVSGAVLKLVAGAAGEPLHVETDYDANRFELAESFDAADGGSWTYRLSFRRKRHFGFFGRGWKRNRLKVIVPRDVPVRLVGSVDTAESEFDLGGLSLLDIDLTLNAGDHEIAFHEPLAQPLPSMAIEARGVELALIGIGYASPRRLEVEQRAGKFDLDLRGPWAGDTEIYASCRVGEIDVRFPDDVRLDVDGDLTVPAQVGSPGDANAEIAPPTLRAHFDTRLCRERQRVR